MAPDLDIAKSRTEIEASSVCHIPWFELPLQQSSDVQSALVGLRNDSSLWRSIESVDK